MNVLRIGVTLPSHGSEEPVTHSDAASLAEEPGFNSGWMHEGLRFAEDALVDLLSRRGFRSGSRSTPYDAWGTAFGPASDRERHAARIVREHIGSTEAPPGLDGAPRLADNRSSWTDLP